MGKEVRTLTGHPDRANPFGDMVKAYPFNFGKPDELVESLRGASTLFNTYWIRFPRGEMTYDLAVENTRTLIHAAEKAGVQRIVHISIANAREESQFPYFRGKGLLEKEIIHSRLSYAIIRPTVIFGAEGILINNIAWILRRFPVFAVPGSGDYRVQPVFVGDVAEIAVNEGNKEENIIMDAAGPEIYTFEGMVRLIAEKIHSKSKVVHASPRAAFFFTSLLGYWVRDVVLTWDEIGGLIGSLLISNKPPTGKTSLGNWLDKNRDVVGAAYESELERHYR